MLAAFWQVSQLRGEGLNGPTPLLPSTVLDWSSIDGPLCSAEVEIILEMDRAYRDACAREAAEQAEKNKGGDQ